MTINTVCKNKHKKLHQKVFTIIFTKFCYKHIWPANFNNIFIIIYQYPLHNLTLLCLLYANKSVLAALVMKLFLAIIEL